MSTAPITTRSIHPPKAAPAKQAAYRRQLTEEETESDRLIRSLLEPPIAFNVAFAKIAGDVNAGLMLSQAYYWSTRSWHPDGWFEKSTLEWEEETYLSERRQETARKKLRTFPFWSEKQQGLNLPNLYRLDKPALFEALRRNAQKGGSGFPKTGAHDPTFQQPKKERRGLSRSRENANPSTETTSETTSEIGARSDQAKIHRASRAEAEANGVRPYDLIRKLAKEKAEPIYADLPSDPAQAKLWKGIYRKDLESAFLDVQRLPFAEQIEYCVNVAATMLMTERVARMMEVDEKELKRITIERLRPAIETVALVPNFADRAREAARSVHNLIVKVAAELLEANRPPTLFDR